MRGSNYAAAVTLYWEVSLLSTGQSLMTTSFRTSLLAGIAVIALAGPSYAQSGGSGGEAAVPVGPHQAALAEVPQDQEQHEAARPRRRALARALRPPVEQRLAGRRHRIPRSIQIQPLPGRPPFRLQTSAVVRQQLPEALRPRVTATLLKLAPQALAPPIGAPFLTQLQTRRPRPTAR